MKNLTLEVYVDRDLKTCHCWRSAPAYGDSHEPASGAQQRLVLNDGQHRVKVGVFNATLTIEQIKGLARLALTAEPEKWAV